MWDLDLDLDLGPGFLWILDMESRILDLDLGFGILDMGLCLGCWISGIWDSGTRDFEFGLWPWDFGFGFWNLCLWNWWMQELGIQA